MTAVELPVRIIHLHANPNPSTRNTEGFSQIVVAVPAVVFGCVCVGGWVSCMLGRSWRPLGGPPRAWAMG